MNAAGRKMPLLVTENYGRGRTAVLATGGTWRWQMSQPLEDQTHEEFWQQLLRWLVTDTPGRVVASVPSQMLFDDGRVQFSADVRDKNYLPAADAHVEAHILGPGGSAAQIEMTPDPNTPGTFHAEWTADQPGSYLTEVIATRDKDELGRDVLTFARMDGVAENFHTEQNRDLLEKLSAADGRALLEAAGPFQAARRNSLFRSGHHGARHERAVEHADRFSAAAAVALLGMAAAAEVGRGVKTRVNICASVRCLLRLLRRVRGAVARVRAGRAVLRHGRGPRRRAGLRAALHGAGEGSRQTFQGRGERCARLHAHGKRRDEGAPDRHARPDRARGQARRRIHADPDRPRLLRRRRIQIQSARAGYFRRRPRCSCATAFPPSAS